MFAALLMSATAPACSPGSADANASVESSPAGMEQLPLTIRSKGATHRFIVEVAESAEQQASGLMFRQSLAPDRGMLFPKAEPELATFWMKNTVIPLDMIFVRQDGIIARIEANAVPQSLEPVTSGEPVIAVLELAGGRAAELGIAPGDKVEWAR